MSALQNWIHKLEVGAGQKILSVVTLVVAVVALALVYDLRAYRNFSSEEAMDSAQLARNISEGKGYTTLFLRPFSLYLVQKHNEAKSAAGTNFDFAQIQTAHPDLANPPVYPVVLAGLMKVLPFHFTVETKKPFWTEDGRFMRYQPEFLIAMFNEILLVAVAVLTFFFARKLFDATVAWISALLVLGCELLWRFSVSGLSTLLLLVIFFGLAWCVLKIEEAANETQPQPGRLLGLAALAGLLVGVGALTRYAFGWTIIPVILFLILFGGQRRGLNALAAFAAFAIVLAPWLIRNFAISGTLFGTAGYAVTEGTFIFPEFRLERSINPDLTNAFLLKPYFFKFLSNLRAIFQNDLPKLGGSWAGMLFLAGLLLGFRSPAARRLRYFLLMCLVTFVAAQALGRTQLSVESPEVNSENLLVLAVPFAFIYSAVFFLTFLEQMKLRVSQLRYGVIAAFVFVSCLPLICSLAPPKNSPLAFPPYYPPDIQKAASWMKENELLMSDVPWAVAWYGQRQCVWQTLDAQDEFFAVNDYLKPVSGLYLTLQMMDGRLVTDCLRSGEKAWGNFVLQALVQNQIPKNFPLRHSPSGSAAVLSGLFLTDFDRWKIAKNPGE
jgi:4-amino-4-deoxy-L-arabinose transferase-like glycosyltransferase